MQQIKNNLKLVPNVCSNYYKLSHRCNKKKKLLNILWVVRKQGVYDEDKHFLNELLT